MASYSMMDDDNAFMDALTNPVSFLMGSEQASLPEASFTAPDSSSFPILDVRQSELLLENAFIDLPIPAPIHDEMMTQAEGLLLLDDDEGSFLSLAEKKELKQDFIDHIKDSFEDRDSTRSQILTSDTFSLFDPAVKLDDEDRAAVCKATVFFDLTGTRARIRKLSAI